MFRTYKRVQIESPWRARPKQLAPTYHQYAIEACRDAIRRGESPYASHLLIAGYDILDDTISHERGLGLDMGHAWLMAADYVAVYTDYGISDGMRLAITRAEMLGKYVQYRSLDLEALGLPIRGAGNE